MTELITDRLELRRWREDDLAAYAAITADPQVVRYLGGTPLDRAATWRSMALFTGHRELRGFGQAALVERSTGRLIGRGGLWQPEGWPGLEIGWVLERASWGRGYARELGRACRDHAFDRSGPIRAASVCSVIHPDNTASIRVATAIGSSPRGDFTFGGQRCLVYAQTRDQTRDQTREATQHPQDG